MNILAIESSAVAAGCAVMKNDCVQADFRLNAGLTHSQTLMGLIASALSSINLKPEELDYIAVSCGPGSFTGIRIGIATVKGLAFTHEIPCIPVSTLEAAASTLEGLSGYACPLMDARCNQFYTAVYSLNSELTCVKENCALSREDIFEMLKGINEDIWLCGDGSGKFFEFLSGRLPNVRMAPESIRMQNGLGVLMAAKRAAANGKHISAEELVPVYLRLPQAQRELMKKNNNT